MFLYNDVSSYFKAVGPFSLQNTLAVEMHRQKHLSNPFL